MVYGGKYAGKKSVQRFYSVDPINNEWYNLCKGHADKNVKRQFIELAASSYEYCYDNPIRFTDTGGEQVPPEQEAPVQETPAGSKIKVTVENDVRIPSTAKPPSQPVPSSSNSQDGDERLNEAFVAFQEKFYSQDYKGAIKVIVDKYQLAEISKLMTAKYSEQLGKSKELVTRGIEEVGFPQFTEITHGDLKYATENITNFSELVLQVTHEYIHAFQRGNLGMKESAVREFIANQHSLFPNSSIAAREGTLTFSVQFPEKISPGQVLTWASNAVRYYQGLPKELQEKYKADVNQIIKVGIAAYGKLPQAEMTKELKDRFNSLVNFK